MADEGKPPEPPRFPPVDEPAPPPAWPPPPDPPDYIPPDYEGPGYGAPGYRPPGYGPPEWTPPGYPTAGYGGGNQGYGGVRRHWLHPLSVGRAFGAAFRLYRLRWRSMLGAYALLVLPVTLVLNIIQTLVVSPAMFQWQAGYLEAIRSGDFPVFNVPFGLIGISLVVGLILGVVGMIANAAVTFIVDANYRGGTMAAQAGVRGALSRTATMAGIYLTLVGTILGVAFIGTLVTVLGAAVVGVVLNSAPLGIFLALIGIVGTVVAIVFISLRWSLSAQAAVCEQLGFAGALGRSWRLVAGSGWRVLGYGLLFGLLQFLLLIPIGLIDVILFPPTLSTTNPFDPGVFNPTSALASTLLTSLMAIVLAPAWVAIQTLLYYDLRFERGETLPDRS